MDSIAFQVTIICLLNWWLDFANRSFAAVTFSVPADSFVTISGDYWLRSRDGKPEIIDGQSYKFRHCDKSVKVPFCSPSLAVVQGEPYARFYDNSNALLTVQAGIVGWSSFERTFSTQPGSSDAIITLYLMQESAGPLSSSYFTNLKIMSTRVRPLPTTISVPAEEPLTIDCNLANWRVNNAFVTCYDEGDYNVLEVSDDGKWSDMNRHELVLATFI